MLRALVIDDNRDVADSFALLLRTLGVAALAIYDGLSGVAAVDEFKPDIVFVDLRMPRFDGYETARRISQGDHSPRPILIALTGCSRKGDRQRARLVGFDAYLTKPASGEEVKAVLQLAPPRST